MKKGFTLVELLAVIIVMGIIGGLLLLNVTNILDRSKSKTSKESIKGLFRSVELYNSSDNRLSSGECADIKKLKNENGKIFSEGEFCLINDKSFLKHVMVKDTLYSGYEDDLVSYKEGEKHLVSFKPASYYNADAIIIIYDHNEQLLDKLEEYKQVNSRGETVYKLWEGTRTPELELEPIQIVEDITINVN